MTSVCCCRQLIVLTCLICVSPLTLGRHVWGDDSVDFFETSIRPLLAERCVKCHGAEKQSGGLRLDSQQGLRSGGESGPVVNPGNSEESLLIEAIRYGGDIQMPPDSKLPEAEILRMEQWVKSGARWPDHARPVESSEPDAAKSHWAFQPVRNPAIPSPSNDSTGFVRNPIDAFVLEKLHREGLKPSGPCDPRTLIRRVTYVLTGLPPTAAEVEAFVENPSEQEYLELVERLLASPAYGEHAARRWLDVARYSDTKGYVYAREERFWVHAWTYRDWVVSAFSQDMPYDRFLLLQIAADQVADASQTDLAAMGFLTLGRRFLGVQREIIDDRIDVVTRGTMALTVGCARCHDHKYDPIPTADYYSLYGVFSSSRERLATLASDGAGGEDFQKELTTRQSKLESFRQERRTETADRVRSRIAEYLHAQFELNKYPEEGFDQILATTDLLPSFVRRWQGYLRQAELRQDPVFVLWHRYAGESAEVGANEASTVPGNPLIAAAFTTAPQSRDELVRRYADVFSQIDSEWKALLKTSSEAGEAPPTSLQDPAAEEIRLVLYGRGSPCVVPDEPVVHTEYDFDSGTCTELWKLQGEVDRWIINSSQPVPFAVILEDRDVPSRPRIFKRGNPAQKGEEVPRQFLKLLAGEDRQPFQHGSGRLELGRCIVDPANPLTARVQVNRVWAQDMGEGLVATPGDFGMRADPPSHPELLDWLAAKFMADGWSVKSLHRLIVTSNTFQQVSTGPRDEADRARSISLDPANRWYWRMNVHRLSFEEMRDSWLAAAGQLDRSIGGKPVKLFEAPYPDRRTLYGLIDRQFLPGTLRMFDFANPDLHIPQRSDTTVPQQALFLMNHPLMLERARELARQAAKETQPGDRIRALYSAAFQRLPTPVELNEALAFLDQSPEESPTPVRATIADWSYGYGSLDEQAKRVSAFTPLPHFTGTAWQGGDAWPDPALGWAQLTATGGHPGNDRAHACIRRWTASADGTVNIRSHVAHEVEAGDGIRAFVISSRQGLLASTVLHNKAADLNVDDLVVSTGETIDFVCDIGEGLNSDQFLWSATIQQSGESRSAWDSKADFTRTVVPTLTPLEQLAQVLLYSNEFLFVD